MKAIYCLLVILVASTFGASAFELSQRPADSCKVMAICGR